jgi:histidine triad (HIT) family protein
MTIFEKIVKGEIPSFKIYEDEDHYAFLDIRPVAPGHTLVIPKKVVDPVFRLDDAAYQKLFLVAKKVSELLKSKISCDRICLAVVGFEVPHAHIHLIPARSMADFPWPGGRPTSPEDLQKIQSLITGA